MKSTYTILDETFPADPDKDILAREKTVVVMITNDDGSTREERFGLVTPDEIFAKIDAKEEINLNRCFINFSLFGGYGKDEKIQEVNEDEDFNVEDYFPKFPGIKACSSWWEGDFNLMNTTFVGNADFSDSTFNGFVDFYGSTFSKGSYFRKVTFSNGVSFTLAIFNDGANFEFATFRSEPIYFSTATFRGNANFEYAIFKGDVSFDGRDTGGGVQFSTARFDSVVFEKTVRFDDIVVLEEITFDTAIFNGVAVFNFADIKLAIFENTFFKNQVSFILATIKDLSLISTVFVSYAVFNHSSISSSGAFARETYRTIKHELIKINNRLDSAEYQRKEMDAYRTELKKAGRFKHILEKFVLFCNRISNNYGTNLGRAICFTFIVSGLFFGLYVNFGLRNTYFQWDCHCSWEGFFGAFLLTIEYFIQFMFIGHNFDFMGKVHPLYSWGYAIDVMGRLAIGYAYYQIFQALRKFKIS